MDRQTDCLTDKQTSRQRWLLWIELLGHILNPFIQDAIKGNPTNKTTTFSSILDSLDKSTTTTKATCREIEVEQDIFKEFNKEKGNFGAFLAYGGKKDYHPPESNLLIPLLLQPRY